MKNKNDEQVSYISKIIPFLFLGLVAFFILYISTPPNREILSLKEAVQLSETNRGRSFPLIDKLMVGICSIFVPNKIIPKDYLQNLIIKQPKDKSDAH